MKMICRGFIRKGDCVTQVWKKHCRRSKAFEKVFGVALKTGKKGSLIEILLDNGRLGYPKY